MLFLVFLIVIVVQNKSHKVKSCHSWQDWAWNSFVYKIT